MVRLPIHPAAEMFPLMGDAEFAAFKADIAAHGLRDPIVTHEGAVLDGRNRYRACTELGIKPTFREWDGGGDPVAFVVSANLHRRHLNEGQRAMVAARIATMRRGERTDLASIDAKSDAQAAEMLNVSEPSVERAKKVQRDGVPELVNAVESGDVSVSAAAALADADPDEQREVVARGEAEIVAKAKEIKAKKVERQRQEREERRRREMLDKAGGCVQRAADLEDMTDHVPAMLVGRTGWAVVTDDCEHNLRKMSAGIARLVFADPPYNIGFDYGEGHNDSLPDEDYLNWVRSWVGEAVRVLTPDGSAWVLINDEYAAEFNLILKAAGLTVRNWIVWYETFGVNCSHKFNRTKRHLFYCVKDPADFLFDPEAVSRPSARQVVYNDGRASEAGKLWDDVWAIPRLVGTSAERLPGFPTQLPIELLRPIVRCCTLPGDLVIDPFNGSGTTGVAAVESGRRYLGIERSAKFAELARLRIQGVSREA